MAGRQSRDGAEQVVIDEDVRVVRRGRQCLRLIETASLQRAARDPEGGPPYPCGRITDCRAPTEELRVGLGHGVAGDVRVTGEGVDRTPQSITVRPGPGSAGR